MEPALIVSLTWLLFGLSHIGLATVGIRGRLVARLGEHGFVFLFSGVATVLFTILVTSYAALRFEGLPGPALGNSPLLRPILIGFVVIGVVLMTATFAGYDRSPYAAIGRSFPEPRGLERITRHTFFAGLVLFSVAHALLATRLVGTVFLAGNAVLAVLGAWHQDRKLAARFGPPFADYLRATSAVPFVAIVSRRQRLVWSELPYRALAVGLVLAFVFRAIHDQIFAYGGLAFVGVTLLGLGVLLAATLRRGSAGTRTSRAPVFPARA
ncbi:MAG: NnrU family protein [Candidatus Binatia bacterium]